MPELPEMENYRTLLTPRMVGQTITGSQVTREKSINLPVPFFQDKVIGSQVNRITRRAKHLLFHLNQGDVLLLHLMLGGSLFWGKPDDKPNRTVQVELSFGSYRLYCIGLRLGYLHLLSAEAVEEELRRLGPDPMDPAFGEELWAQIVRRKRGSLKAALVDQSFLSGIGGCYSDEICYDARLLPSRRLEGLETQEANQLYRSIRQVLKEATLHGGYMDMPLYTGDSLTGGFDSRCRIYDREGEPCFRCGTLIVREDVSSKKSFCCPGCQR